MAEQSSVTTHAQLHLRGGHLHLSVPIDEEAILALARRILKKRMKRLSKPFEDADLVQAYLTSELGGREQEVFSALFLDQHRRLIAYRELFFGSIHHADVHPREIVKQALQLNAAALIVVHNHPSGNPKPSIADRVITQRIKQALALVDIELLDHFIVAGVKMVSLQKLGEI